MRLHIESQDGFLAAGSLPDVDLPNFTVITGPNGSGKTQLLELVSEGGAQLLSGAVSLAKHEIRYYKLGDLSGLPDAGPDPALNYATTWAALYENYQGWLRDARTNNSALNEQTEAVIYQMTAGPSYLSREMVQEIIDSTGRSVLELTEEDFQQHVPLILGRIPDPFSASLKRVFTAYTERLLSNDMAQVLYNRAGKGHPLTPTDFERRFGKPPWTVMDEVLTIVGLNYSFVPPSQEHSDLKVEVRLLDAQSGQPIEPSMLSSGEKVLLSLACALYSIRDLRTATDVPRCLLLDEPDASLHPSMVKSLLTVLQEIFVSDSRVNVIMTTHSPTTVALAPESSLWTMTRSIPKLRKVQQDEALRSLTVGLPTLSIKNDGRRQIFVEADDDQGAYQSLFEILRPELPTSLTANFIASGKKYKEGAEGGGCDAVIRLVAGLRQAGNDQIKGLIDRDARTESPDDVYFSAERYSLENYIFDPLLLGTLVLRERLVEPEAIGLEASKKFYSLRSSDAALIEEFIRAQLGLSASVRNVSYVGGYGSGEAGFEIPISVDFCEMQGHDLEAMVRKAFPALAGRFSRDLKGAVIERAARDCGWFIPQAISDLFVAILS